MIVLPVSKQTSGKNLTISSVHIKLETLYIKDFKY